MSKKNRVNNVNGNGAQNLPAPQDNSANEIQNGENKGGNKMDSNEVKQNWLQKLGSAILAHGDKKAAYALEHPTASKVKTGLKIAGGVITGLTFIGGIVYAVVKGKDGKEELVQVDDYYDDNFDDPEMDKYIDEHLDDEDVDSGESEDETDDTEETETDSPEETI